MRCKPWEAWELEYLKQNQTRLSHREMSAHLGRSPGATKNKVYSLGWRVRYDGWQDWELDILRCAYDDPVQGELCQIAELLGRSRANISTKAAKLGLTGKPRRSIQKPTESKARFTPEERSAFRSEFMRQRHAKQGHPMLGKKHTLETIEKVSAASKRSAASKTKEERSAIALKAQKSRVANGNDFAAAGRGSWKAGWREIGGKRNYYRSRWEANYARYLEWLKANGKIAEWAHEPETFWFDAIKRGVRSYKPDFRVWENDGSSRLHEVKGWMDARSKTTLKRMAKYHPSETIVLIKEKDYNAIAKQVKGFIEGWEESGRSGRQ